MKKVNDLQRQILNAFYWDGAKNVIAHNTDVGISLNFEKYKNAKLGNGKSVFDVVINSSSIVFGYAISTKIIHRSTLRVRDGFLTKNECLFFKGFCRGRFGYDFNF